MATVEERLARLEGKVIPLQNMRQELYEDYLGLKNELRLAEEAVGLARTAEVDASKKLKDAREAYGNEEAALLATDERAGGKNDTERKRNADNLVAQEKSAGGRLYDLWFALGAAQYEYEQATAAKESAIDHFSTLRYIARMVSGLAQALGA